MLINTAPRCVVFSEVGRQLLGLIEPKPAPQKYIEKFASIFQVPGVVVSFREIVDWKGDSPFCKDLREVLGNKPKPDLFAKPSGK